MLDNMRAKAVSNGFSRTTENESKMGAYYTNVPHCKSGSGLFRFPKGMKVCVLEPSIGDGSAVIAVTKADTNPDVEIFAVEINEPVAKETAKNPYITQVIPADFLNGVKIQNDFFTFVFENMPYMADDEEGGRYERKFLEKTVKYMAKGGVAVLVIPYSFFSDISTIRYLMNHFEWEGVWKFREEEYKKWHQIWFVGRKSNSTFHTAEEVADKARDYSDVDAIPVLPETFEGTDLYESIEVLPSDPDKLKTFTSLEFDAEAAISLLCSNPPMEDYHKIVNGFCTQPEFKAGDIGNPPIPLKKDSLYLLATSGAGQGEVGEEGEDLHLQRGVAEIVEHVSYEKDKANADKEIMKVTTSTEVTMTVIETSGKVTVLK